MIEDAKQMLYEQYVIISIDLKWMLLISLNVTDVEGLGPLGSMNRILWETEDVMGQALVFGKLCEINYKMRT